MGAADRRSAFAYAWLAAALCSTATAQQSDAPRAPRILDRPTAAESAPIPAPTAPAPLVTLRPPTQARLAPLPEERIDAPEEIIVIGQGWRLPDLGSEWRARQEEAARSGRFSATLLPLYDPSREPLRNAPSIRNPEERRHGYIDLIRLRFGRRSRD